MSKTKKAHENVVASISDTDLVMVTGQNGGCHPISAKDFISSLQKISGTRVDTYIMAYKNNWIRLAKASTQFCGLLSLIGYYSSNQPPVPAFIAFGGYNAVYGQLVAVRLNTSSCCISALRFVKDGSDCYIEVKYNHDKSDVVCATLSNNVNASLIPATLVADEASNVLKTIEFSGGGITNCHSASYAKLEDLLGQKGGAHERHEVAERQVQECADGCLLAFESLDSLCRFIWSITESCVDEGSDRRIVYCERTRCMVDSGVRQNRLDKITYRNRTQERFKSGTAHHLPKQSEFDFQSSRNCGVINHISSGSSESSVCSNASLDGSRIAQRKEVAV